ncbi:MAG TPA: hypothetical protein DCQ64_10795 [Candidatus Rokubacteria bacterium]|nr:hypothetical protein [Candidatus Rokubacteria bacterium]
MPIPTTVFLTWRCDECGREDDGLPVPLDGLRVREYLPQHWHVLSTGYTDRVVCDRHAIVVGVPFAIVHGKAVSITWPVVDAPPVTVTGTVAPDGRVSFVVTGSTERM